MSDPVRALADADVRRPDDGMTGAPPERNGSPFGRARERGSGKARIIDAARQLFCARGYERTPLRAVSDSLGVTKAAIYHHFKAKEDLLVAVVGPLLDWIDDLIESTGPSLDSPGPRRDFLGGYLDALTGNAGIVALLLGDPGVREHAVGRRFASQHLRLRSMLGTGDEPAGVIRATTALRGIELAVVEFSDAHPDQVREVALDIAVSVLESRPGSGAGGPS